MILRRCIVLRRLARDPRALFALVVLGGFVLCGLFAPWIAPYDPSVNLGRAEASLRPPCSEFLLGTDMASRDLLSRLLYGARASLAMAGAAVAVAMTLGAAIGAAAGEAGGRADALLMRATDFFLSIPTLVLLLASSAFLGRSAATLVIVLGATGWMGTARLVRAEVLVLRRREFVLSARGLGQSRAQILLRHVLPHVLAPLLVSATLGLGGILLAEASLSFLGFGVPEPAASWGRMVADGRDVLRNGWWVSAFPALAIALCVTAANLAGDALREACSARSEAP